MAFDWHWETEEEFKARVFYITGNHRVEHMDNLQLTTYASLFGLTWRKVKDEPKPPILF